VFLTEGFTSFVEKHNVFALSSSPGGCLFAMVYQKTGTRGQNQKLKTLKNMWVKHAMHIAYRAD